ncbi:MAG: UvrD-helicase domain-containing protein [Polyangiales bacterium]
MSIPLNPAQKAAVAHSVGPALVLAGAGSGKTRVITQRMARLIDEGTPPRMITALTFTNKAAEEMHERLVALVGNPGKEVWISTFHALGGEVVRREMPRGEAFVVYDQADCASMVRELLREAKAPEKRWDVAAIISRISNAKNAMLTPEQFAEEAATGNDYDDIAAWIYPRYEAALRRHRALDFDDLILWPLRHLTDDASAREAWRRKIRFMLVDEFQDTNRAQLLLVKALVGDAGNVFCVGDDDQSIYGWRGADISNVIDFSTHFPGAKTLALEQNYRSRKPVLDLANSVMEGQVRAFPKRLFTDKPGGAPVQIVETDSSEGEVKFVVDGILKRIKDGQKKREMGVLYRSNLLSRAVEEALRLANVPYRIIGGSSVYERKEVKDLIAYLRLAVHPDDEISLRRVLNYPTRGIGDATVARVERYALARGCTLFTALERIDSISDIHASTKDAVRAFTGVVLAARAKLQSKTPLLEVAQQVTRAVKLKEDILAAGPSAIIAGRRWGNVESLYKTLERADAATIGEASAVLARLMLRFSEEDEDREDKVTLSTLHGSKGLEFGTVWFIGCDEGIIPHSRTDAPKATDVLSTIDATEERRLFYVGVTRAKEQLYLVRAKVRSGRGATRATIPSRFLKFPELPPGTVETVQYDSQAPLAPQEIAAQARAFREALMALKSPRRP